MSCIPVTSIALLLLKVDDANFVRKNLLVKNSGCDKQHILSVACIWVNNKYAVDTRVWVKCKGYHKLYWVTLQIHDIVQS